MTGPRHADHPAHAEPAPLNPDALEVAPGTIHDAVQGWVPELATEDEASRCSGKGFRLPRRRNRNHQRWQEDRRIHFRSCLWSDARRTSFVRVLPKDSNQRQKIAYADIAALAFTGRDPAAGKSWEAWVRKYWEKKASGEAGLSLQPESLE